MHNSFKAAAAAAAATNSSLMKSPLVQQPQTFPAFAARALSSTGGMGNHNVASHASAQNHPSGFTVSK